MRKFLFSALTVLLLANPALAHPEHDKMSAREERKPISEVEDETLILADQGEMALNQLKQTIHDITSDRLAEHVRDALASDLSEGRWTHDYPVTVEQARKLGLTVTTAMPPEVLELMALYPQPIRRQPSVEYSPGRRGARGR